MEADTSTYNFWVCYTHKEDNVHGYYLAGSASFPRGGPIHCAFIFDPFQVDRNSYDQWEG